MQRRFVLWDLDGTLVDSGADIARAANAACVDLGRDPITEARVRSLIGEGARALLDKLLGEDAPESLRAQALARFFEHYERDLVVATAPYPGIDALVRSLAGRQGIATNKPGAMSRRIVEAMGWSDLFVSHVGVGDVPNRKPAPDSVLRALELAGVDRTQCVFVGDSPIDLATSRAAGVDFIAVSWGMRPRHELIEATCIVDSVAELEEALLRLDGDVC